MYMYILQTPSYKHRKSDTFGPIRRNPPRRTRMETRSSRRHSDPVMDSDTSPTNVSMIFENAAHFPISIVSSFGNFPSRL